MSQAEVAQLQKVNEQLRREVDVERGRVSDSASQ